MSPRNSLFVKQRGFIILLFDKGPGGMRTITKPRSANLRIGVFITYPDCIGPVITAWPS